MLRRLPVCALAIAGLALSGCGAADEPSEPAAPAAESATFAPLTDTLDRAAGVETVLQDAAAERRRALEAQE